MSRPLDSLFTRLVSIDDRLSTQISTSNALIANIATLDTFVTDGTDFVNTGLSNISVAPRDGGHHLVFTSNVPVLPDSIPTLTFESLTVPVHTAHTPFVIPDTNRFIANSNETVLNNSAKFAKDMRYLSEFAAFLKVVQNKKAAIEGQLAGVDNTIQTLNDEISTIRTSLASSVNSAQATTQASLLRQGFTSNA